MLKISTKHKYQGQALAIAMVVLVVSSLIGISIYSRSLKDKRLTLEERASAEALEVSDLILTHLSQYPISKIEEEAKKIAGEDPDGDMKEIVLKQNKDSIEIGELIGRVDASQNLFLSSLFNLCPLEDTSNEYQVRLGTADENDYFEIRPGHVWALPVKNFINDTECDLRLKFAVRGDSGAGFVISKVFCKYDESGNATDCLEYWFDDSEGYCFSNDGGECNNDKFLDQSNWVKYNLSLDDGGLEPIDLTEVKESHDVLGATDGAEGEVLMAVPPRPKFTLSEIRVKAVYATIGVSYNFTSNCLAGFKMYRLRVTASCDGVYRGKEMLIPEIGWHSPIFDYSIFNGKGSI